MNLGHRGELWRYLRKWIPISVLVGIFAGIGAIVFQVALDLVFHASYESASLPWYLLLLIPAVGGLLAGLIISRFAPETAGSGTDHVLDSIHHHGGKLRPRTVPVKIVSSALTIGTGGSAGNEGPISQISGGIASAIGTKLHLSRSDMRVLVISGMAAGWSAVFRAPLGSAIFALEVPYMNDMEGEAAVPAIVASVSSYLVFTPFAGSDPIFSSLISELDLSLSLLALILLLGAVIGIIGIAFVTLMKKVRKLFAASGLPLPLAAFIGGLAVGAIGLCYPDVLGLGEGSIQEIITGSSLTLAFLAALLIAKMLATSMTVGSGGSGGIFFPSLMIGGLVGGCMALAFGLHPFTLFVLVGMGSMMAGVSKTPIAAAVLMTEMVGGFIILIPLMLASVISYLVSGRHSLYDNQVMKGKLGLDFTTLGEVKIDSIMVRDVVTMSKDTTIAQAKARVVDNPHHIYPVVDGTKVVGTVARARILECSDAKLCISDIMSRELNKITSGTPASSAFELMSSERLYSVIIVDNETGERLVGLVTRMDVLSAIEHMDDVHLA